MGNGVPKSKHFVIQELGKGVYAAIATDGGWAVCNAGIVDLGDSTLVFDTFVNQHAALELKDAAEQVTGKPVNIVINSHWHSDHVKGNQAFAGARIVATGKTREVMAGVKKRYETEADVIRRDVEKDLESVLSVPDDPDKVLNEGYDRGHLDGLPTLRYTLPVETFEDSMKFHGNTRLAETITYGGGHTVSDSLLYLPEEGVAYLGDLLFIEYQPYLCDGDPKVLLEILDKVEALDAKTLVPGHGPVGSSKDISPIRDYVNLLERTVAEVRSSGGGLPEAVKKPIPASFGAWKWRGFYKDNLEFLFKTEEKRNSADTGTNWKPNKFGNQK
jgi:cyclase